MVSNSYKVKEKKSAEDPVVKEIRTVFEARFPKSAISIYKQNSVSVRVRIFDEKFADKTLTQREKLVAHELKLLSKEALADLSMLLLLAPNEKDSIANLEFRQPMPSRL